MGGVCWKKKKKKHPHKFQDLQSSSRALHWRSWSVLFTSLLCCLWHGVSPAPFIHPLISDRERWLFFLFTRRGILWSKRGCRVLFVLKEYSTAHQKGKPSLQSIPFSFSSIKNINLLPSCQRWSGFHLTRGNAKWSDHRDHTHTSVPHWTFNFKLKD